MSATPVYNLFIFELSAQAFIKKSVAKQILRLFLQIYYYTFRFCHCLRLKINNGENVLPVHFLIGFLERAVELT